MATALDYARLRADIGANETSLPDLEAEALFVEAGESYSGAGLTATTRVLALRRLLASSAKLASYTQNASREELSDIFKHLQQLLAYWEGKQADADHAASSSGAARFGKTGRIPSRVKEYPGL